MFQFSSLYTTLPHKLLLKVLSEIISFVFKSKVKKRIGFFKAIYWNSNEVERGYFTKQSPANAMSFLINKCFFIISNNIQSIGMPTGICDIFHHECLDTFQFIFIFKRCRIMFTCKGFSFLYMIVTLIRHTKFFQYFFKGLLEFFPRICFYQ